MQWHDEIRSVGAWNTIESENYSEGDDALMLSNLHHATHDAVASASPCAKEASPSSSSPRHGGGGVIMGCIGGQ